MAVDSTLLLREVDAIIQTGGGVRRYGIECRILTPDRWMTPHRTTLLSLERDYEDGYGDVFVLEVTIGLGDYAYGLFPHRDRLSVDLTTTPTFQDATNTTTSPERTVRRFRAILMDQDNPGLVGRSPQSSSESDLNATGTRSVQLQLIEEGLYQIRMASVGRVYRQVTPMTALRSILTETTQLVDSKHQQQIYGVDHVAGYNSTLRQHVVIPHGTPLTAVPGLLQNQEGGIYGSGLSCYLQDGYWRVFPSYDTTRWQKTPKALTILNIPPNRYYGAERTYRQTGNQVVVVSAGEMATQDDGLFDQLNDGNAVRVTDVNQLLAFGATSGNRTLLQRKQNVYEFEATALSSGMVHTRWAEQRATSNPFKHYSTIAHRNGRYLSVQWLHGDSALLYPGMPVKFMAAIKNQLAVFHGVLLGVHDQRIPTQGGAVSREFNTSVQLKLFLSRLDTPV